MVRILKNRVAFLVTLLIATKVILLIVQSPSHNKFNSYYTDYKGVITGNWTEYCQKNVSTCGVACLSFLLSKAGYNITESQINEYLNKDNEFISFLDMESVVNHMGLKSQSLEVEKEYFKSNPAVSIVHFGEEHFVVFFSEYEEDEVLIFDPSYGSVYLSWDKFLKKFDGKMFYVYT